MATIKELMNVSPEEVFEDFVEEQKNDDCDYCGEDRVEKLELVEVYGTPMTACRVCKRNLDLDLEMFNDRVMNYNPRSYEEYRRNF